MILNCILETGLEATEWKQWEVWVWNRQICETVFLRSGSKDLAMGFTDSREGFRIGSTSSPQVQLWFVFHSKYLASWMLLWLNFSRVAILNPKQSRRICSVVKQHFSECLEITKVRCYTIFSSKQSRETNKRARQCQGQSRQPWNGPRLQKSACLHCLNCEIGTR